MPKVATIKPASGVELSYAESGSGSKPAVLFVPGPTDSWRSYEKVLELLPHNLHAVAVSPRGHGDSDKPDRGYDVATMAGDLVELMDSLEIERAVLVGHSGSTLVTRRAALDHPERVAGLVLEASPTGLTSPGVHQFVESLVSDLADTTDGAAIDEAFVRTFVADTSSNLEPGELDELVAEVLKVPAHVWVSVFTGLLDYEDLGELGRINAPTLLLWGDMDPLVDREMQDSLLGYIPNSELIVYPGGGHTLRWEDPSRFSADVASFVERISSR